MSVRGSGEFGSHERAVLAYNTAMASKQSPTTEVNVRLGTISETTINELETAGLQVQAVQEFLRVATGSIDTKRIPELERLECVENVEISRQVTMPEPPPPTSKRPIRYQPE